jgi:hypothetical protein
MAAKGYVPELPISLLMESRDSWLRSLHQNLLNANQKVEFVTDR